jgi:hypothetical protein
MEFDFNNERFNYELNERFKINYCSQKLRNKV